MNQDFSFERRFHFNLRKPRSERATPIYFVTTVGGKQYKLATNVKVIPKHWDQSKQVAIISNVNTKLDNKNNRIVNERLSQIKGYYSEFISYLCEQEETPANFVEVLKEYIYKDMTNKKTLSIDVIKTIRDAFNYYYTNIHQTKESTLIVTEKLLNRFIKYVDEKNLRNNVEVFSQTGLNAYKAYLIDEMNKQETIGKSRINTLCQLIERLINNVLVVNNEYQQYKFTPVKYVKLEDKRLQDDIKRFPLFDEEVKAIKECQILTDKEKEYGTIFLLQCASGQRISDILQVIKGNYEEKDGIITIQTIKKGIYSQIFVTDEIKEYLEEVKKINLINLNKFDDPKYNKALKDISKKSGLERTYKWKDSRGKEYTSQIWEIMVSHNARHTFITNKAKEGIPYNTLCLMTGHADDKMIKSVYANLTKEDKADKVRNYYKENESPEKKVSKKKINLFDELFAIPELKLLKDMRENGINIFNQTDIVFKKLRDTTLLAKAMEELKDITLSIDKGISELIWMICKFKYETKAYQAFQYKCLKLGISNNKPIPEEELAYIWQNENESEYKDNQENWQLYEFLNRK